MPTLNELTLMFMRALVSGQDLRLHVDSERVYQTALDLAITYLEKQQ